MITEISKVIKGKGFKKLKALKPNVLGMYEKVNVYLEIFHQGKNDCGFIVYLYDTSEEPLVFDVFNNEDLEKLKSAL